MRAQKGAGGGGEGGLQIVGFSLQREEMRNVGEGGGGRQAEICRVDIIGNKGVIDDCI